MLTRDSPDHAIVLRMQPVRRAFARMPQLVRDVSARLGKSVRLVMSGERIEADRAVIEKLRGILTHMVRNAIDHGIERPADRLAAGKLVEGTIEVSVQHAGSNIVVHVADDGRGLDRDHLVTKAIEEGVAPPGAKPCETGVTADASEHETGLDVIRRGIVDLGGRIAVRSVPGRGTTFTLVIPRALAAPDGRIPL